LSSKKLKLQPIQEHNTGMRRGGARCAPSPLHNPGATDSSRKICNATHLYSRCSLDVVLLHGPFDGDVLLGCENTRAQGTAACLVAVGAVAYDLDGRNEKVSGVQGAEWEGERR
jgi:hypothetical protein